jgi:hypothetical protein
MIAASASLSCAPEPGDPGREAIACGDLVGFYLGASAPVDVTGSELDLSSARVRIDYRTTNRMNLPVDGVALCRFRERARGRLEVSGAFVDENRLGDDEIEAFNASR